MNNPLDRIPWSGHLCLVCGDPSSLRMPERRSGSAGTEVALDCTSCNSKGTLGNAMPWRGIEMIKDEARGLFMAAGIPIIGELRELPNQYWKEPGCHPWWFVRTHPGWIEIGWRKRVISIDWSDTPIRGIVTQDDLTQSQIMVHAYSMEKALEYLTTLRGLFLASPAAS